MIPHYLYNRCPLNVYANVLTSFHPFCRISVRSLRSRNELSSHAASIERIHYERVDGSRTSILSSCSLACGPLSLDSTVHKVTPSLVIIHNWCSIIICTFAQYRIEPFLVSRESWRTWWSKGGSPMEWSSQHGHDRVPTKSLCACLSIRRWAASSTGHHIMNSHRCE
jgi:hypothetical protein